MITQLTSAIILALTIPTVPIVFMDKLHILNLDCCSNVLIVHKLVDLFVDLVVVILVGINEEVT